MVSIIIIPIFYTYFVYDLDIVYKKLSRVKVSSIDIPILLSIVVIDVLIVQCIIVLYGTKRVV